MKSFINFFRNLWAMFSSPGWARGENYSTNTEIGRTLADLAAKNPQKLNYDTSVVDLMKLVGMDWSLANRQRLAQSWGYRGDVNDTAPMNIWLHGQIRRKLAASGGRLTSEMT